MLNHAAERIDWWCLFCPMLAAILGSRWRHRITWTYGSSMQTQISFLLIFLLFPFFSHAASFDCKKVNDRIEILICEDRRLSDLDEILNRTYKEVLIVSNSYSELKTDQKRWLAKVRSFCKDADCIFEAYEERISDLRGVWAQRMTAMDDASAPVVSDQARPFEGIWESCELVDGYKLCTGYKLLQENGQVCGEWNYWATYRRYSGRLKARVQRREVASIELACGDPHSFAGTECDYGSEARDTWVKAKHSLSLCGGRLYGYDGSVSDCSELIRTPGDKHRTMTAEEREGLLAQSWMKRCLGEVSPENFSK